MYPLLMALVRSSAAPRSSSCGVKVHSHSPLRVGQAERARVRGGRRSSARGGGGQVAKIVSVRDKLILTAILLLRQSSR